MIGAYIIGEPGAGKSAAVAALVAGIEAEERTKPFAHTVYYRDAGAVAAQIGGPHPKFPGTDRLSMSVQPDACDWLWSAPTPVVFAEGDRLATAGFLDALGAVCEEWWLFWLKTDPTQAEARRAARGSTQDDRWLAGRRTKAGRLAERFADHLVQIVPGDQTAAETAATLAAYPPFAWASKEQPATP